MCVIAGYAQSGVPRPQSRLRAENSHCTILHTLKLHHHVLLCVCHCRLRTIWCAQNGITQKTHIAHLAHIETAPPCLAVCVSLQATHDLVCPGLRAENSHCTILHTLKLHHHVLLCVGVIAGYARSGVPRPQDGISAENSHCEILHTLRLHHHVLLCVCVIAGYAQSGVPRP